MLKKHTAFRVLSTVLPSVLISTLLSALVISCQRTPVLSPLEEVLVSEVTKSNPKMESFQITQLVLLDTVTLSNELERRNAIFHKRLKIQQELYENYLKENMPVNAERRLRLAQQSADIIDELARYRETHVSSMDSLLYFIVSLKGNGKTYNGIDVPDVTYYASVSLDLNVYNLKEPQKESVYKGMGVTIPEYLDILRLRRIPEQNDTTDIAGNEMIFSDRCPPVLLSIPRSGPVPTGPVPDNVIIKKDSLSKDVLAKELAAKAESGKDLILDEKPWDGPNKIIRNESPSNRKIDKLISNLPPALRRLKTDKNLKSFEIRNGFAPSRNIPIFPKPTLSSLLYTIFGTATIVFIVFVILLIGTLKKRYQKLMKPIDMGTSVLWADRNAGAEDCDQDGGYFALGEDKGDKEFYDCSEYDPRDTTANLKHGWRLPTKKEFFELVENCDIKQENGPERHGFTLTSRNNGHAIFFPAAGAAIGNTATEWKERGYYRVEEALVNRSSLDAEIVVFDSDGKFFSSTATLWEGLSVRPVRRKKISKKNKK